VASGTGEKDRCVFCEIGGNPENDETNYVVHRGVHCYAVLNLYPYITGHLLLVPYRHVGELAAATREITDELMDLARRSEIALRSAYNPAGFNVGMNLGGAAGAGIVDHIHMHVLPRWGGDTNFMTSIANTRVLPETLDATYAKLRNRL
jgi:ATP adenylyltransferase